MQFTLQAGESAALAPAGTVRVRCHAGFLWITGFRNGADVVLGAGDSALLPPRERHYFSALGATPHAAFDLRCEDSADSGRGRGAAARVLAALRAGWRRCRATILRIRG